MEIATAVQAVLIACYALKIINIFINMNIYKLLICNL